MAKIKKYVWLGEGVVHHKKVAGREIPDTKKGDELPENIPEDFIKKHVQSGEIAIRDYTERIPEPEKKPKKGKEKNEDEGGEK